MTANSATKGAHASAYSFSPSLQKRTRGVSGGTARKQPRRGAPEAAERGDCGGQLLRGARRGVAAAVIRQAAALDHERKAEARRGIRHVALAAQRAKGGQRHALCREMLFLRKLVLDQRHRARGRHNAHAALVLDRLQRPLRSTGDTSAHVSRCDAQRQGTHRVDVLDLDGEDVDGGCEGAHCGGVAEGPDRLRGSHAGGRCRRRVQHRDAHVERRLRTAPARERSAEQGKQPATPHRCYREHPAQLAAAQDAHARGARQCARPAAPGAPERTRQLLTSTRQGFELAGSA